MILRQQSTDVTVQWWSSHMWYAYYWDNISAGPSQSEPSRVVKLPIYHQHQSIFSTTSKTYFEKSGTTLLPFIEGPVSVLCAIDLHSLHVSVMQMQFNSNTSITNDQVISRLWISVMQIQLVA